MSKYEIECYECEKEFKLYIFEAAKCCEHHIEWDEDYHGDVFPYWEKDKTDE
jgi:hypothetical protein